MTTMFKPTVVLVLVAGLAVAGGILASSVRGDSAASDKPAKLAEARLKAANEAYRLYQERHKKEGDVEAETLYLWSNRILNAERDAASKEEQRITALQAHLDRMMQLESETKRRLEGGKVRAHEMAAAEFYRLEAELWLARGKGVPLAFAEPR